MSTITFDEFSVGLDHRKSANTSDANRLRELKNAYVTTGKVIRKRAGAPLIATLEAGTKGLVSGGGVLNTFYDFGSAVVHADTRFLANPLEHALGLPYASAVSKIHYGDVFNGFSYIAAEHADGAVFHYWIDGTSPNRVTNVDCPNTKAIVKQQSRLFAVDGSVVGFCGLDNNAPSPKDWTAAALGDDPGFLATGNQAKGSTDALALAEYDGRLAVFFTDSMQLWDITTDAVAGMTFYKSVEGIGCKYPKTPVIFAGDIIFLSRAGFRSVTTQTVTSNLSDVDVGSPIDKLVKKEVGDATDPFSAYFVAQNQYWCAYPLNDGSGNTRVWVYTYSKSSKVAAWSKYELGFSVEDVVVHDGYLHFRSGDSIYRMDETETVFTDGGKPYDMEVVFPFIDCKQPGVDKYFESFDLTVEGTVDVQFKYDPNDETKITDPITITGDTRPLQSIPLEITSTAIAPVFKSSSSAAVEISAFAFNYQALGVY